MPCDGSVAIVQHHHCPSCSFLGGRPGQLTGCFCAELNLGGWVGGLLFPLGPRIFTTSSSWPSPRTPRRGPQLRSFCRWEAGDGLGT